MNLKNTSLDFQVHSQEPMNAPTQKDIPSLSVVVPVYNSEGSLQELHRRVSAVFARLKIRGEMVFVNDCSKDKSWNVLREIAESDGRVTSINLMNNFGQDNAVMCGIQFARGRYVVTMDDDLQHPPEEIEKLYRFITRSTYDVVYGQYVKRRYNWFRDFCADLVKGVMSRIAGGDHAVTSFRIMTENVMGELRRFSQYNVMVDVLIKDVVSSSLIGNCPVEHHARIEGRSNYSYRKLFAYMINMIFSFTLWPLRVASIFGFIFSFISICLVGLLVVYYGVYGVAVSGWTSLIISITFFSGLILFVLGIMGEYVGKIYLNINNTPQYVVREVYTLKR